MTASFDRLVTGITAEFMRPSPDVAVRSADSLLEEARAGAIDAVVFYGARRRDPSRRGMLDFYVVVSDYERFHASRLAARVNAVLAPHVVGREFASGTAKLAVVDWKTLEAGCQMDARRPHLWARFCQPFSAPFLRGDAARDRLARASADAVLTAMRFGLSSLPPDPGCPVEAATLWPALFARTFAAESRPEGRTAARDLYDSDRAAFDARWTLARDALIEAEKWGTDGEGRIRCLGPEPRWRAGRVASALQLAKSAVTFGPWLPYALGKLEHHCGVRLEANPRQRRHPWLFAWPLVWRALRERSLR